MVNAPMERCFKLAVSIDLMMASGDYEAVAGVTSGLIGPGDTVTWQYRRLVRKGHHQSMIEVWHPYTYFRDIMIDGPFKSYEHDHHFALMNDATRIRDEIRFSAAVGFAGTAPGEARLQRNLTKLLHQRNALLKQAAESDRWHDFLDGQSELDMRAFQASNASLQRRRQYLC